MVEPVIVGAVDAVLRDVLGQAQERARSGGPGYALLWEEITRSVRGGKGLRAQIVLRTHGALAGDRDEAAAAVAAAFELLHTAYLVHDDLIDRDTVRRGEPNLAATMFRAAQATGAGEDAARRWSEAAAVLAGDLALALAHQLFAGAPVPARTHAELQSLLAETMFVSAGGELADSCLGLGLHRPTLAESLAVAEAKTAMYSFQAPLRAGAILAGAQPEVLTGLDRAGRLLGQAYQLVDDLLGVFGSERAIGKSNLSDLREGKVTPLILHARSMPVWQQIGEHVGRPDLDPATAAGLRRALATSEAPARVHQQVQDCLADVADVLAAATLPAALTAFVAELAETVAEQLGTAEAEVEAARAEQPSTVEAARTEQPSTVEATR